MSVENLSNAFFNNVVSKLCLAFNQEHRNLKMKRWFHNQYSDVFFEIRDFTMYFLFRFHILLKD